LRSSTGDGSDGLSGGAVSDYFSSAASRELSDSSMTDPKESYIIAQALYEFVRCEQAKPIPERRISDVEAAKAILHARFDNELAILMKSDEAAGRESPDCWRKASIGG
jgi:hypothetical protein